MSTNAVNANPIRTRVAFAGLGVMGFPMAQCVARAGFELTVTDLNPATRERAAAEGLVVAETLAAAGADASIIVAMLPDTPQVDELIHGPGGILSFARPGVTFVDMSTISPLATAKFAAELAASGIGMIDAPVSGSFRKAMTGELSIMAGGDENTLAGALPVLSAMGKVTHMGEAGCGQATKACNQVAVTLAIQANCEAFALGAKLGLDLEKLHTALMGGAASSWIMENLGPAMIAGDDGPGFRIALQVKDLRIASEAAQQTTTYLPGLSSVLGLYTEAMSHGQADDGNQALYRVYERLNGAEIGKKPAAD